MINLVNIAIVGMCAKALKIRRLHSSHKKIKQLDEFRRIRSTPDKRRKWRFDRSALSPPPLY